MLRRTFDRKPHGTLDLDLCFDCRAIWFDPFESAQLTPGAVIGLFREIHERTAEALRPLASRLPCPRCRKALQVTHDIQRTNRITYYRCPDGHGRLSTFVQFLREKNFVRSLTAGEVERLKAHVAQVRCSSCGAPVNLERDAQCAYCRAPIAILDAEAVRRTLAELSAAERERQRVDPTAAVDALLAGRRSERQLAAMEGRATWNGAFAGVDLVTEALDFLMSPR